MRPWYLLPPRSQTATSMPTPWAFLSTEALPPRLELEPPLARALCERRDAAVVFVTAPIKDRDLDADLLGLSRDELPNLAGRVLAALGLPNLAGVGRRQRASRVVVDEVGGEDRKSG